MYQKMLETTVLNRDGRRHIFRLRIRFYSKIFQTRFESEIFSNL